MPWNPPTTADIQQDKAIQGPGGFGEKTVDSLEYLYGQISTLAGIDIPNGSAEIDSDSDGTPDSWTANAYPGGTVTRETSVNAHGAACFKAVHPGGAGNGGGYWESDYVECSEVTPEILGVIHWATAAGMKNQVVIRFFSSAKVDLAADQTLYSSTNNPTSATQLLLGFTPPATARYYKVRLIGGYTDTNVPGTSYFDGITRQPLTLRSFPVAHAVSLAEQTTTSGTYVDKGSFVVDLITNLPCILTITGQIRVFGGGQTAYQRFREGSNFSTAGATSSLTYVNNACRLTFSPTTAGAITVYQQLYAVGTAYGKVDSHTPDTRLQIDSLF